MPRCYISLGGNLGAVAETFDRALEQLARGSACEVRAVSRYRQTKPVGDRAGEVFLNAAAEIETSLSPLALLDHLQSIERALGRTREVHWGPRTLDLDLLFYGSEIIDAPRLVVPHSAAWYRRFVLDPLAEIAPHFIHPVKRAAIVYLRERLLPRPLVVALVGGDAEYRKRLAAKLRPDLPDTNILEWTKAIESGVDPALAFWLGQGNLESNVTDKSLQQPQSFEQLPLLSRIDVPRSVSDVGTVEEFIRDVLQSALG